MTIAKDVFDSCNARFLLWKKNQIILVTSPLKITHKKKSQITKTNNRLDKRPLIYEFLKLLWFVMSDFV